MARYEGMEEIIQRLTLRFGQEDGERQTPGQATGSFLGTPIENQQYSEATQSTMRLLREAEHLHDLLAGGAGTLSQREHDDLLVLLGTLLQELWNCEVCLQRVAPYD